MFRKLTFLTLLLAFAAIVLGSYLRVSDISLVCHEWPQCYGKPVLQVSADLKLQTIQAFMRNPFDLSLEWNTLAHLYTAFGLGLGILLLTLISWREKHCRGKAMLLSVALLLLYGLQAMLGVLSVKLKLMPVIVTAHLLFGFGLFWLLFSLYIRVKPGLVKRKKPAGPVWLTTLAIFVLVLQVFLGVWVSSNYAALACTDFPLCNGQWWWPQLDYIQALDVMHGLLFNDQQVISEQAQLAVHWLHRLGGLISLVVSVLVFAFALSSRNAKPVRRGAWCLLLLVIIQSVLGVLNIVMTLPVWSAVAHTGVAALLMLPLLYIRFYARYELKLPAATPVQTPETITDGLAEADDTLQLEPVDQIDLSAEADVVEKEDVYVEKSAETLFLRLSKQLQKTRTGLGGVLANVALGQKKIDDDLIEEIEANLIMADVGMEATTDIIKHLTENVERNQLNDGEALSLALKTHLLSMLEPCNKPLKIPEQDGPFVILVVGVNGAGKTTTIGKMAKRLQAQGHSVMLAAGDTFRAAAVEQLQTWGERNKIHVVAQHTGADSASVLYDAVQSAQAKGIDVLIADTAGRLHTKSNLMEELKKVKRIIGKLDENAPQEVLLVLDAGTGQNALMQAKQFDNTVKLTGIALTKLDGTAKGGVIFALAKQFNVPIRFIGIGEGIDDLQDFNAEQFVDALFINE